MRRVKRLKESIARLERASVATEAQLEEEFDHGYAAGFNAASAKYEPADTVQAPDVDTFLATIVQQVEQIVAAGRVPGSGVSYRVKDWAAEKAAEVRALLGTDTAPDKS